MASSKVTQRKSAIKDVPPIAVDDLPNEPEDVPELEDMSDLLQTLAGPKMKEKVARSKEESNNFLLEAAEAPDEASIQAIEKLLRQTKEKPKATSLKMEDRNKGSKRIDCAELNLVFGSWIDKEDAKGASSKESHHFGGFKKGFLLAKPSKGTCKSNDSVSQTSKLEEIKPNGEKKDHFVFEEVQEALRAQMPLLQSNEWVTGALLSKLEKNPKLLRQLENPKFTKALAAFQNDPKQMARILQSDPDIRAFLQEFCGVLGDHFTDLGVKHAKEKDAFTTQGLIEASSSIRIASASEVHNNREEKEKVKQIISDPTMRDILSDARIQELIAALKDDPNEAQRILAGFDQKYHNRVKRLIEAGLLTIS